MKSAASGAVALAGAVVSLLCTDTAASQGAEKHRLAESRPLSKEECSPACRERIWSLERQVRSLKREVSYLQGEVAELRRDSPPLGTFVGAPLREDPLLCEPPYMVDDGGIKRYRFECLEASQEKTSGVDCSSPYRFRKDGVKLVRLECL